MTTRIAPSLLPPISNWKKPVFFITIATAVTAATAALFMSSIFAAVGYALLGLIATVFYREDGLTKRQVQQLTSQNDETVQRMNALNQELQGASQINAQNAVLRIVHDQELDQTRQGLAQAQRAVTAAVASATQQAELSSGRIQQLATENVLLVAQNRGLNDEHQVRVRLNEALTRGNAELTQEIHRLNGEYRPQAQEIAALTLDNQRLSGENQQQAQANVELTQVNTALTQENRGLTRRNQALAAENGILKHKTVQAESIAKEKESFSTTQERVIKGYEEVIAKSTAETKDLREKNEDLTAVVETMKIEINRTSNANKALKLEVAGLNTKVHEFIQEKENAQNQESKLHPLTRRLSDPLKSYIFKPMGSTVVNIAKNE